MNFKLYLKFNQSLIKFKNIFIRHWPTHHILFLGYVLLCNHLHLHHNCHHHVLSLLSSTLIMFKGICGAELHRIVVTIIIIYNLYHKRSLRCRITVIIIIKIIMFKGVCGAELHRRGDVRPLEKPRRDDHFS